MYSLIVIDYYSMEKTISYIFKVQKYIISNSLFHAIIVDNAENKSGFIICEKHFGQGDKIKFRNDCEVFSYFTNYGIILYCSSGKNLGYAKGNNLGAALAKFYFKDPYYLISNNDLDLVDTLYWEKVEKIFNEDSHIAVIGPKVIGIDGKPQSPHKKVGPFTTLILYYWAINKLFKLSDLDYTNKSKECYRVIGCFMFVRASSFHNVGGFDSHTFMFAEEMILSELLKKEADYFYFWNEYVVIHEHGYTTKKTNNTIQNEKWSYESCRYYYKSYRKTSKLFLLIADINFKLYIIKLKIKLYFKKLLWR